MGVPITLVVETKLADFQRGVGRLDDREGPVERPGHPGQLPVWPNWRRLRRCRHHRPFWCACPGYPQPSRRRPGSCACCCCRCRCCCCCLVDPKETCRQNGHHHGHRLCHCHRSYRSRRGSER
ncbi:hypothetical protein N658DRAFT_333913 [Parathielavia hyrcaniae]|uniref:Uncharacterized protein n=1 Tax=Parathielavia hyrcaniae TaxID=113614 RepID=A0AAN6SXA9_9PEZI|nr:hypothetical protein N658DRAFT_333913 [Parathielavia hyrcaniae]